MPKHLSMFWAATKQLSEPSRPIKVHWEAFITCVLPSLLQTVLSKRILFPLPTPFQPLTPSPQQPRESGSFLHSPVWSQVSPLSQGLGVVVGREQTGHVGMSVWGKSKVAARAGQGVGGLMLKSGSAELSLAGGNSTPFHWRPRPQWRDVAWERGWGLAV